MNNHYKENTQKPKSQVPNANSHRKELEHNSENTLTPSQWENCKKYFDYSCAYCGLKPEVLSKDHFVPLNLGGGLTVTNIVPCCQNCNSSKSNRKFSLWYKNTPFYTYNKELKILVYLKSVKEPEL